jgi:hypothetical protein
MECRWTKYYAELRRANALSILELAKGFEPLTL